VQVRSHLKQLAGESLIYGVSGTISIFIGFILLPLLTRVFTPEEYGIVELVDVLFMFLTVAVVLGLDAASTRWFYDSDDPADRRKTIGSWFWCQFSVSGVLALLLIGFAPGISRVVTGSSDYALLVVLSAAALPLQAAQRVFSNWLRYQRRPWAAVAFAGGTALTSFTLVVLFLAVWHRGLVGLYTAKLAALLPAAAAAAFGFGKWIALKTFSWERLKSMLRYGIPLAPAAVGLWVVRSADRYFLQNLCDTREVGLFAVAAKIATGVAVVLLAFTQAWAPFAFSILHQPNSRRVYVRALDAYSFLGCGLCTATALFAPLLVRILATREAYYPAASSVAFLAFASLFSAACPSIASLGVAVAKKSIPTAVAVAVGLSVSLALNLLLIPLFGRNGAAAASMVAWFASMAFLFAASQRAYPIPFHWGRSLACLACSFAIIEADAWLVPGVLERLDVPLYGPVAWLLRTAMLLSFVPLGIALGFIRWRRSPAQGESAVPGGRQQERLAGDAAGARDVLSPVPGVYPEPGSMP
jgi:O-antigen/teichoic acid export membrane protein